MAVSPASLSEEPPSSRFAKEYDLSQHGPGYNPEQQERLRKIHARLIESRRELDALIGDAYLRARANIVPVHFLDLASAVEKLRWAEKEWRELDREMEAGLDGARAEEAMPTESQGDRQQVPDELLANLAE
jgi:hypothetical protein